MKAQKSIPTFILAGILLVTLVCAETALARRLGIQPLGRKLFGSGVDQDQLWEEVQSWRIEQGRPLYLYDTKLCEYADLRINQIKTDWSHGQFRTINRKDDFVGLGENLSKDYSEESKILDAWLGSPSHRENLEKNYTHSCIRCENNYCVQLFGEK